MIARGENDWEHVDTIRLPASLWFEDFSSLAIDGGRLCVVSQESSALWLGRLAPSAWEVVGDGVTFMFPADADRQTVYCNVEGVSWLSHDQVAILRSGEAGRAALALPGQGPVGPSVRDP